MELRQAQHAEKAGQRIFPFAAVLPRPSMTARQFHGKPENFLAAHIRLTEEREEEPNTPVFSNNRPVISSLLLEEALAAASNDGRDDCQPGTEGMEHSIRQAVVQSYFVDSMYIHCLLDNAQKGLERVARNEIPTFSVPIHADLVPRAREALIVLLSELKEELLLTEHDHVGDDGVLIKMFSLAETIH